jgi:hypothetical protein
MFASTVILSGTVIVEGVPFRWWVTDGLAQQLTVSHPAYGTDGRRLTGSPHSQARSIARAMLASRAATGFLEAVDDTSTPDGVPEPTLL